VRLGKLVTLLASFGGAHERRRWRGGGRCARCAAAAGVARSGRQVGGHVGCRMAAPLRLSARGRGLPRRGGPLPGQLLCSAAGQKPGPLLCWVVGRNTRWAHTKPWNETVQHTARRGGGRGRAPSGPRHRNPCAPRGARAGNGAQRVRRRAAFGSAQGPGLALRRADKPAAVQGGFRALRLRSSRREGVTHGPIRVSVLAAAHHARARPPQPNVGAGRGESAAQGPGPASARAAAPLSGRDSVPLSGRPRCRRCRCRR
jgi:hypothetical protein